MKKFYLIISLVLLVTILIISFSNWLIASYYIFFWYFNSSLTIGFMFIALLGMLCGFSFAMYLHTSNGEEIEESSEEEEDF